MRLEHRFVCNLRQGMHARPASMLAEALCPFTAAATLAKRGGDEAVELRSVLSVIGLDIMQGDECLIVVEGDDAEAALAALEALIAGSLAEGDDPPAERGENAACGTVPIVLERLGVALISGRGVSGGIAEGVCVMAGACALSEEQRAAAPGTAEEELSLLRSAAAGVRRSLAERAKVATGVERALLNAHASIADDPALREHVRGSVRAGMTAAQALHEAADVFAGKLAESPRAAIRERAIDVRDVVMQILAALPGGAACGRITLTQPSIVFAETLTPSQLLGMDRELLKGLVLGRIGETAHTIILARSRGLPTLIDVAAPLRAARPGQPVMADADAGVAVLEVTPGVKRYAARRREMERRRAALLTESGGESHALEVGCNASGAADVIAGMQAGAQGVGLLRTELLFHDRAAPPGEEEQFEAYAAVVRAAAGEPVIIRTFDIGGDKPAAYLPMKKEDNPFLGVRGARLYDTVPGMLETQLRAALRASTLGPVKIMAPMITLASEAAAFRARVQAAKASLGADKAAFDAAVGVGAMVEVPSLAFSMEALCKHVDFISIGTNDLTQYLFAVDRGNAGVAALYNPHHPALVAALRVIIDGAKRAGKWVGVCGEMASDPLNLPLFVGLGVDEVSVSPAAVSAVRGRLRRLDAGRCRRAVEEAAAATDATAVQAVLHASARSGEGPLLTGGLIELDVDASTKEEAIRAGIDLLWLHERTARAAEVERAVWKREEEYSTGFGHGFAVPHCKCEAVHAPTLAVLRLRRGVEWGSLDGEPVDVVMLLAVPADAAAAHMQVLAKLARRLMHEEFRERVRSAGTPSDVERVMREELTFS